MGVVKNTKNSYTALIYSHGKVNISSKSEEFNQIDKNV